MTDNTWKPRVPELPFSALVFANTSLALNLYVQVDGWHQFLREYAHGMTDAQEFYQEYQVQWAKQKLLKV